MKKDLLLVGFAILLCSITPSKTQAQYCAATNTDCGFEFINNFALGTINNNSPCQPAYEDYSAMVTNLNRGQTYTATATRSAVAATPVVNYLASIWVDWNQNFIFDDATEMVAGVFDAVTFKFSFSITPPNGALSGPTRLRLRMVQNAPPPACGAAARGDIEDYTINLVGVLPIEFSNFTATVPNKTGAVLNWSVQDNRNIQNFTVQSKTETGNWENIGTVNPIATGGNTNYTYTDKSFRTGVIQYRIMMVQNNSGYIYSEVKLVKFNNTNSLMSLSPNPTKDFTKINIYTTAKGTATVQLLHLNGIQVTSFNTSIKEGTNTINLPLHNGIASGIYIVKVTLNNEVYYTKLQVIQ